MRGVGGERALLREGALQPRQQAVQRRHQRAQFNRQALGGERRERGRRALRERVFQRVQRAQRTADDPPDQRAGQRQQRQQRPDDAQRGGQRLLAPLRQRLRHADRLHGTRQRVDAPHLPLVLHVGPAVAGGRRQRRHRARAVRLGPARIVDLHQQPLLGRGGGTVELLHVQKRMVAQRQRDLPQFFVEQAVDLRTRAGVGERCRHRHRGQQRAEQCDQQPAADRAHQAALAARGSVIPAQAGVQ